MLSYLDIPFRSHRRTSTGNALLLVSLRLKTLEKQVRRHHEYGARCMPLMHGASTMSAKTSPSHICPIRLLLNESD